MAQVTNFFLGANSGAGFQNLFPQLTEREDLYDLMILKGGPGVGKSTFMKQIGRAMEEAGTPVEYLWCSGDPDSLDGILLPGLHCAVADGTAPHVLEPRYPAAVDRYVDLGRFYDLTAAKQNREAVIADTRTYKAAYTRAYHCLQAARQIEEEALEPIRETMDWERADRRLSGVLSREFRRRKSGQPGRTQRRFLGSITHQGLVWRFDSVRTLCPKVYELTDSWELGSGLFERLQVAALERGLDTILCPAPEEPSRIEHLLIPELGLAFVTSKPGMLYDTKPYRHIRLDAMARPQNRARLRFEARMTGLLRDEAISALQEAKQAHDALEAVYNPYVDFDGVRALAAQETGRLLSYLE